MKSMLVNLTWDDEAFGPEWLNPDNLAALLYSKTNTNSLCLEAEVIDPEAAHEFVMRAIGEASLLNSSGAFDLAAVDIGESILDFFGAKP